MFIVMRTCKDLKLRQERHIVQHLPSLYMPLLTELDEVPQGVVPYKHGAPNGA